jgi:hypothetical protein
MRATVRTTTRQNLAKSPSVAFNLIMDAVTKAWQSVNDAVTQRPVTALIVSHAITSAAFLYVVSEGKPVQYVSKKLFKALVAAVPASIIDGELSKVQKSIEESIIGHHLDGESILSELPEAGMSRDALISELQRYGVKDGKIWKSGKVSKAHFG